MLREGRGLLCLVRNVYRFQFIRLFCGQFQLLSDFKIATAMTCLGDRRRILATRRIAIF